MELRQLRYLAAVAREGSFSAAAQRLAVAQPAISQQVRKLEQELGLELLHRVGGVRPTPAGERVLVHAERVLADLEALQAEAADAVGLLSGRVALGSMQWMGAYDLPRRLARFAEAHPRVELALVERTSGEMLAALRRDELDLTFVSLGDPPTPEDVELELVGEEELVVAGNERLLGSGGPVELASLDGRPMVAFAPGMSLRAVVDEALAQADARPWVVLESNEPATVRALAAHGAGVAILPRALAEAAGPPLVIRSAAPEPLGRQLGLAWRRARRLSPAAAALRDELLDAEPRAPLTTRPTGAARPQPPRTDSPAHRGSAPA